MADARIRTFAATIMEMEGYVPFFFCILPLIHLFGIWAVADAHVLNNRQSPAISRMGLILISLLMFYRGSYPRVADMSPMVIGLSEWVDG